jgi:putative PIN family toxin of toxin-antitoxin system
MRAERVAVDTNVLISAALLAHSAPALLLHLVARDHRLVFSPDTFEELETRLWRPKFDRYISMEDRKLYLHDLAAFADWVRPDASLTQRRFSRDADDDKFVRVALAAQARWLLTGDDDLLTLGTVEGVSIITAARAQESLQAAAGEVPRNKP